MLDLKVEMSGEPVVEERLMHVACRLELRREPVQLLISLDVHWQMIHLRDPDEPVTVEEFGEEEQGHR